MAEANTETVAAVSELARDIAAKNAPLRGDGLGRVTKFILDPYGTIAMAGLIGLRSVVEVINHPSLIDGQSRRVDGEQTAITAILEGHPSTEATRPALELLWRRCASKSLDAVAPSVALV